MTQLSPDQSNALDAINAWLKDPARKPFFSLEGLAGTGKTTIAVHLANSFPGRVYGMAYTGKACHVLTRKGLPASTLHSTIYLPAIERKAEAEALQAELEATADQAKVRKLQRRLADLHAPSFVKRAASPFQPNSLIICDEMSMVGPQEAQDLLSFGIPVLVLGDQGQLPPIDGKGYFIGKPDFQLEQIHRQAAESPVIRLATLAREGRALPPGKHGDSLVTTRKKITPELALSCAQIICGSNKARIELNQEMRGFQSFTAPLPQKGERLICLRNNPRDGLLNGQMVEVAKDMHADAIAAQRIILETTEGHCVPIHRQCFYNAEVLKTWSYDRRKSANEFDYAYAITGYKSQGSQFESVLAWDEMFKWDRDLHARHLYTVITRAENRVTVAL